MISYETFGPFYDAVMGDRKRSAGEVRNLLKKHKPDCRTVLELACGTGAVLQHLQKHYQVAGLDISPAMLRIAKKRLKDIPLYRKSMTTFELRNRFDAIVCVFDSINHLTKWSDWKRVFRQAYDHLEVGGVFIFDVNTPAKLKEFDRAPVWVHEFGPNLLLMNVTCDAKALSRWNVKVFEPMQNNLYRLHEEDIFEKAFPYSTIKRGLRDIFEKVQVVDLSGKVSKKSSRLHFICERR